MSSVPTEFAVALSAALSLHPLVAEVLWQRGYRSLEAVRAFLDPTCYTPTSASALPDLDLAVARLREAIAKGEHIRIWGDFDVDGQTATSVLLLGLRELGASVDYTIPNRATHSHGLNKPGIARAKDAGVRVLLTCDCGATDFEEVASAQWIGLDVIISDHHDLARNEDGTARLPNAVAVVNPKRLSENHPLVNLPGVGVAYKLIEALFKDRSESLLDLVALGIVADVAYQRGDTRYLLQRGLEQLRHAPHPGVRALMRAARIEPASLDADNIGYQIGPRLNAAGRLASAELSVELLTAQDEVRASELAAQIEQLNEQRKVLQRAIEAEAMALLEREPDLARYPVIVLQSATWHPSVIGGVASAIVNRYKRPAILITARPGEIGRGSARSAEGIDIHAAIIAQSKLIEAGGGHPMAAGFSIRSENVAAFREGVSAHAMKQMEALERLEIGDERLAQSISDASVAWRDVSAELAEQIERLAPFGAGNPRPVLRSDHLRLVRVEPLGRDGRHQMVYLQDASGNIGRAAWWRSVGQPLPNQSDELTLTFTVHRDVYNGRARAKVEVEAIASESQGSQGEAIASVLQTSFFIVDLRGELDRATTLRRVVSEYGDGNVQIWSREQKPAIVVNQSLWRSRAQLQAMPVLVIWDTPPGPDELADGLKRASPQRVVLLCAPSDSDNDRDHDDVESFMRSLLGMVKVSEQRGDSLDDPIVIARMAARINQREAAIRAGLDYISLKRDSVRERLAYVLNETRAYRRYFQQASADEVLRTPSIPPAIR